MMENEPIRDPRIVEAMEACRPGRDDLADPDLAFLAAHLAESPELYEAHERLQRIDLSLAKAFQEVPVPEGLADRILQRLTPANEVATPPPDADPPVATVAPPQTHGSRRRWLLGAAGLGLTLAASLLVAVMVSNQRAEYRDDHVLEMAVRLFETESFSPAEEHLAAETPPPKEFPISPLVLQHAQLRWRSVPQFLGRSGVAYDLTVPGEARATLYVVRQTVTGVPTSPGTQPALTTHNCSVSAWQSGSLLYVLVVDGGARAYRGYLDIPQGPVARRSPASGAQPVYCSSDCQSCVVEHWVACRHGAQRRTRHVFGTREHADPRLRRVTACHPSAVGSV
jgi:hypothetical protein